MEFTFLPKELAVEFIEKKQRKVIKVGMKIPEVESVIGKPKNYHTDPFDPDEKRMYKNQQEWYNIFGRTKKAIYINKGLILGYYDDIITHINLEKPAKANLDGKNLLGLKPNPLYKFMKERGYVRVNTFSSGDAFRGANLFVVYDWNSSGPSWVAIADLSKETSSYPEDKEKGLTLMNCPTRVKE